MSTKRKIWFGVVVVVLLALTIIFWGSLVGGCAVFALILGIQMFLFGSYANSDLAETFNENGKNVEGWRD